MKYVKTKASRKRQKTIKLHFLHKLIKKHLTYQVGDTFGRYRYRVKVSYQRELSQPFERVCMQSQLSICQRPSFLQHRCGNFYFKINDKSTKIHQRHLSIVNHASSHRIKTGETDP
jgi:hypothetical protein